MKVVAIDVFKHWAKWCNWLFVRVSTDEGLHGWGEGSLHGAIGSVETAIHELSPILLGEDPSGPERHWHRLYHAWRWRGGPVQQTAIGALDTALWDLEGKRLGVPVYRLLGGPLQMRFRAYASHWLDGVQTPEAAQEGARDAVRRGFSGFKWTPFGARWWCEGEERGVQRAATLMEAARSAVGPDVDIFLECGEHLSPRTAIRAAEVLGPFHPGWLEEPIPFENPKAMARLQRAIAVPIATGERLLSRWEYRELLEEGGCQVVQPDVMHAGGITEVRKIAAMADTALVSVAPHNPGGPISMLAAMHLMASIPNALVL
ncbi:MAG: mandelate racemase/muconate lactonizing enzyme family protein, partial [Candidatus Dormiibacterota bacterium]